MAVRTSTNQLEKHKGNRVVGCNQPGTQPLIKQHSFCIAALSATDGSGNKATASATMTMGKYEHSVDLLAVCCSWVFTQLIIGNMKKVSPEKREQLVKEQWELRTKEYFSDRSKAHWEQHPGYKKEQLEKIDSEIKGTDFYESADICRFFLDGKLLLSANTLRVESGHDTSWGTLQYDSGQWPFLRESSLGFISLDKGKNWDAVFMAYGMETTNFIIQSLDSDIAKITHYHGSTPSFR